MTTNKITVDGLLVGLDACATQLFHDVLMPGIVCKRNIEWNESLMYIGCGLGLVAQR